MTMEQIFEKIKQDHGEAVFGNVEQLLNLFADYSKGKMKPQQNQLDIFLKCDGNTRILKVGSATRQEQQAVYNRLIQKMVEEYGLQRQVAIGISSAFWRAMLGTEPPALANTPTSVSGTGKISIWTASTQEEVKPLSANEVPRSSGIQPSDSQALGQGVNPEPVPIMEKTLSRILRHLKEMSVFAKITFLIGLISMTVLGSEYILQFDISKNSNAVSTALFVTWFLLMISNLIHLWKDGFDFPGILGAMMGKNSLLAFAASLVYCFFTIVIYLGGPFLLFSTGPLAYFLNQWEVLTPLGVWAGTAFGIIWYIRRLLVYRDINLERHNERRRTKVGKR